MKIAILSLASLMALGAAGAAGATANTCTPVKHKVVHRTLVKAPVHRTVRVLADSATATTYDRPAAAPVYEREYEAGPAPVYYEEAYPGPYPVYGGPYWVGYGGPRFYHGYGFHRGWGRRW